MTLMHDKLCAKTQFELAMRCVRGSYQLAIVQNRASLSGSDLQGRAAEYGSRYADSRARLLYRMYNLDVCFAISKEGNEASKLVYGVEALAAVANNDIFNPSRLKWVTRLAHRNCLDLLGVLARNPEILKTLTQEQQDLVHKGMWLSVCTNLSKIG